MAWRDGDGRGGDVVATGKPGDLPETCSILMKRNNWHVAWATGRANMAMAGDRQAVKEWA